MPPGPAGPRGSLTAVPWVEITLQLVRDSPIQRSGVAEADQVVTRGSPWRPCSNAGTRPLGQHRPLSPLTIPCDAHVRPLHSSTHGNRASFSRASRGDQLSSAKWAGPARRAVAGYPGVHWAQVGRSFLIRPNNLRVLSSPHRQGCRTFYISGGGLHFINLPRSHLFFHPTLSIKTIMDAASLFNVKDKVVLVTGGGRGVGEMVSAPAAILDALLERRGSLCVLAQPLLVLTPDRRDLRRQRRQGLHLVARRQGVRGHRRRALRQGPRQVHRHRRRPEQVRRVPAPRQGDRAARGGPQRPRQQLGRHLGRPPRGVPRRRVHQALVRVLGGCADAQAPSMSSVSLPSRRPFCPCSRRVLTATVWGVLST
jgi:hypothetical protein